MTLNLELLDLAAAAAVASARAMGWQKVAIKALDLIRGIQTPLHRNLRSQRNLKVAI